MYMYKLYIDYIPLSRVFIQINNTSVDGTANFIN